jgi:hypothetical protein
MFVTLSPSYAGYLQVQYFCFAQDTERRVSPVGRSYRVNSSLRSQRIHQDKYTGRMIGLSMCSHGPADPQEKSTRQKLSGGRLLGQCRKYNAAWRSRRTARWATQLCCLTRRLGPRVDAIDQFPVVSSVLTPFFWRSTGRGREG